MKYAIVLLATLILITGCGPSPTGVDKDAMFRIGSEGLSANFLEGAPPDEIMESYGTIPLVIELENKGAHDIEKGILTLVVDEPIQISKGQKTKYDINLRGRSEEYATQGEQDKIVINADVGKIPGVTETFDSSISATMCYDYKTEAVETVCIDTDPFGFKKEEKVCEISEKTFSQGQGGPVGITRIVTETPLKKDDNHVIPAFKIYIDNLWDGQVMSPGKTEEACSGKLTREDYNKIEVKTFLGFSDEDKDQLECDKTTVNLEANEPYIRCKVKEENAVETTRGAYETPLRVEMQYGYSFTIRKPIFVYRG